VIIDFCKKRLAAYKYPWQGEIVLEIPKILTGKFLGRTLGKGNLKSLTLKSYGGNNGF